MQILCEYNYKIFSHNFVLFIDEVIFPKFSFYNAVINHLPEHNCYTKGESIDFFFMLPLIKLPIFIILSCD